MWTNIDLRKCVSLIECGFHVKGGQNASQGPVRPAITMSRMAGAPGHSLASTLTDYVQTLTPSRDGWAVIDRTPIEETPEDHHNKRISFDRDIDDPILYHLIIHADRVPHEEAAHLIGHEVIQRFRLCEHARLTGSVNRTIQ